MSQNLKDVSSKVESLPTGNVSIAEYLTDKFLTNKTSFSTLQEFLTALAIKSIDEWDSISKDELDKRIRENTSYNSFEDMLAEAVAYKLFN